MTQNNFLALIKQPELVAADDAQELKEILELYPYFSHARLLHAKALQKSNSVVFGYNLKFSSLYTSNKRWLYYYIHPDKMISTEPYKREKSTKSSGDYFDMMNSLDVVGVNAKQTLRDLAERLKSARSMVTSATKVLKSTPPSTPIVVPEVTTAILSDELEPMPVDPVLKDEKTSLMPNNSESYAKKLIQERRFIEAIEILKDLNLNNPKKSVYFADQIRFLEKVIANTKK